jgi:hypothetical protein
MLNYDVKSYLRTIQNAVPREVCDKTVEELEAYEKWKKHSFSSGVVEGRKSYVDDFLSFSGGKDNISTYDTLTNCFWNSTFQYIYSLDFDWYTEWAGFSELKFNKYVPGTRMRNHCDHINSIFEGMHRGIPTLSIIAQLNDSYEGGELIFWNDEVIKLNVGDVLVFPSNFLYPHKVETVTSGTRYSVVSWVI